MEGIHTTKCRNGPRKTSFWCYKHSRVNNRIKAYGIRSSKLNTEKMTGKIKGRTCADGSKQKILKNRQVHVISNSIIIVAISNISNRCLQMLRCGDF